MIETLTNSITRWVGSSTSIILHTIFFVVVFGLLLFGVDLDTILLVLTTAVSLEAIYLALFIQRSVNQNTTTLEEAAEDIQNIEEEIEDIGDDVEEMEKDLEELGDDVDDISEDIGEVGKDLDDLEEDLERMQDGAKRAPKSGADIKRLEKELSEIKTLLEKLIDKQAA